MRTLGRVDEAGVAALAGVGRRRDALEGLVPDRAVVPARLPGVIDGDEARVVRVARPRPPAVKREEPGIERAGACVGQRAIARRVEEGAHHRRVDGRLGQARGGR